MYERRLSESEPLGVLARFFLFGQPVDRGRLEAALGPNGVDTLVECRMLQVEGNRAISLVRLTPFAGLIFAHDPEAGAELTADHVTGIGPAPRTLHALTIRQPVARALDIGTGCGVQALFLARHASHVVATDVNPRALWLARCNAALNAIQNVEWREGSLFEPVSEETFDLIVANPPFVQSPDNAYIFRDGDSTGNICQRLTADAPLHLDDGGYAQALISWGVGEDGDWEAEPRQWLEDRGCDAWLLHYQTEDGLDYAAKWNAWLRESDQQAYAGALDRWTAYYAERNISALATGAITMRRKASGTAWWRADHMITGPEGSAGRQVQQVFATADLLSLIPDASAMLTAVPRFCGDHRLEQRMRFRHGAYAVEITQITLDEGVGVVSNVDPQALLVILSINGEKPLTDLLAEASEGMTADEAAQLTSLVLENIRHLAMLGVVELAGLT